MRKGWRIVFITALAVLTCSLVVSGQFEPQALSTKSYGSLDGYYAPSVQPIKSVQDGGTNQSGVTYGGIAWGGLTVGYTGEFKKVKGSSEVTIPRLSNDKYGVIETNVTVKRLGYDNSVVQELTGKALAFSDLRDTADSGYVMVNVEQAERWIEVLNGNPNFVFSSKSNVYSYKVKDVLTGDEYVAYNLAEIANACGGAGNPPGNDGLTKLSNDLYYKRDGFIATPQPDGSISLAPSTSTTMGTASFKALKSSSVSKYDSSPQNKIIFVNENGDELENMLLIFANVGDPNKLLTIVLDKKTGVIFTPAALDKTTKRVQVSHRIGQITKVEGDKYYFMLDKDPELNKQNPHFTIKQQ